MLYMFILLGQLVLPFCFKERSGLAETKQAPNEYISIRAGLYHFYSANREPKGRRWSFY